MAEGLHYRSAQGHWVLAATILGSSLVLLDSTVVGIALPTIGREFNASIAGLQWIINAYTLTLAGFLLPAGALGDRMGRRRVFMIGVAWFAAASLLCGMAPDIVTLTAARALQGIGGALLMPGSLAILQATFAPVDRARSIGAWSAWSGMGAAVGPFVGGYLIDAVSWRLIFYLNLPVTAAVLLIAWRYVPESRDEQATGPIDIVGAVLAVVGLAGLTYGLIEGPERGWTSPDVLGGIITGLALLAAFVVVEIRIKYPLIPMQIFRSRQFDAANAATFLVYAALGGVFFLTPLVLQEVSGYSPIAAGAALLPITLVMLAFSSWSGALAARIGPRLQMSVGPVIVGIGMSLLVLIDESGSYFSRVFPGVLTVGAGLAITVAPLTATVLAAAPAKWAGVASGINNDVARAAGLIAVAILPAIGGITHNAYVNSDQLNHGFRVAVLTAALGCLLGGLTSAVTIRNRENIPPQRQRDDSHCAVDAPPLRGHNYGSSRTEKAHD